jgi:DNA-binding NarL/FixJ family response regulator
MEVVAMPELLSSDGSDRPPTPTPRLTNRQHAMVLELAQGFDIATVAERRKRSLSATYELADRICTRLGLSEWQQIGPWAHAHGLADSPDVDGHQRP